MMFLKTEKLKTEPEDLDETSKYTMEEYLLLEMPVVV